MTDYGLKTIMDNDKIVFYRAPATSAPRSQRRAVSPPSSANSKRQWLRFKSYEPKAASFKFSQGDRSHATQLPDRSSRRKAAPCNKQQPANRKDILNATPGQHVLLFPKVLSAADPDPFRVLPAPCDSYDARMLQLYIDRGVLTAYLAESIPVARKIWLEDRKHKWLPLAMSNPSTFNALVLYMETAPGMPESSAVTLNQRRRLAVSFQTLNADLADSEKASSDSTVFAIVLLMHVAEHMGEFETFQAHGHGLEAVVARRRNLPAKSLPSPSPDSTEIDRKLARVRALNVLRPEVLEHARYWHSMATTFPILSREDWVLSLASQHMMTTGFPFSGRLMPLEEAFAESLKMSAVRMYPLRVPPPSVRFNPQDCVQYFVDCLQQVDLQYMYEMAPDMLLWMAITVGPLSQEAGASLYLEQLLRTSRLMLGNPSFREARRLANADAIVPAAFDALSKRFWDRAIGAMGDTPPSTATDSDDAVSAICSLSVTSSVEWSPSWQQ